MKPYSSGSSAISPKIGAPSPSVIAVKVTPVIQPTNTKALSTNMSSTQAKQRRVSNPLVRRSCSHMA